MSKQGKLVYILPPDKLRPTFEIFFARVGGVEDIGSMYAYSRREPAGPVCVIKPSGEVRMFETGTILEVQGILSMPPYDLSFEELRNVYDREVDRAASDHRLVGPMTLHTVFCKECGGWEVPRFDQVSDHEGHIRCDNCGAFLLLVQTVEPRVENQ